MIGGRRRGGREGSRHLVLLLLQKRNRESPSIGRRSVQPVMSGMNFPVRAYHRKSKGRCRLPFGRSRFCFSGGSLSALLGLSRRRSSFSGKNPFPSPSALLLRSRYRVVSCCIATTSSFCPSAALVLVLLLLN